MANKKFSEKNNLSLWQKIKMFFNLNADPINQEDDDDGEGSDGSGVGKLERDSKDAQEAKSGQYVKEPETVLYDELKRDPAAMIALKALTQGQIPVSEAAAAFERVKNSSVAIDAILNSAYAPPDVKAKAREEKAKQERRKLQAQEGFKKSPPKPGF